MSHHNALTAPYYVYIVLFRTRDIPSTIRGMPAFPRTKRKIWVWKRETRDLLLKLDPKAKWEKHEARKCHRCGRWMLGLQAQMQRDRDMRARFTGKDLEWCGDS